jgi:hypothetical protein
MPVQNKPIFPFFNKNLIIRSRVIKFIKTMQITFNIFNVGRKRVTKIFVMTINQRTINFNVNLFINMINILNEK